MKKLLLLLTFSTAAYAQEITYRFDDVKRSVTLTSQQQEAKVAKGQLAKSGDGVHTGWFSYALVASERHRAKFEIYSSSDVELASGTPGVILSLKKGRIHAIFDKITGNEPRIVQTPGALLAVRGTQYTVSVNNSGETTLDVFEGVVEVRSPLRPDPLLVPAGQSSDFGRRRPPDVYRTPSDRGPRGPHTRREPGDRASNDPRQRDGNNPPHDDGGMRPRPGGAPGGGGGGMGGGGGQPAQPPQGGQQPPQRPPE